MQHEIFFLTIVFFIQVTSENKDQTGLYTVFNSDQIENTQNIDFFFHTVWMPCHLDFSKLLLIETAINVSGKKVTVQKQLYVCRQNIF